MKNAISEAGQPIVSYLQLTNRRRNDNLWQAGENGIEMKKRRKRQLNVAVKWLSIRLKNGEMKYSKKLAAEEM
jgi:hypothetical protein